MENITSFSDFLNESRMVGKKNIEKLIKKVTSILDEYKFTLNVEELSDSKKYAWTKTTDKYGKLEITIYDENSNLYSVFIRFFDVQTKEDAKKLATNKYSGKTNIHTNDLDDAIDELTELLDKMKE